MFKWADFWLSLGCLTWLLNCHSSHRSAVAVRRPVEVLPADHAGHPGRGPPPHEGDLHAVYRPACCVAGWCVFALTSLLCVSGGSAGPPVQLQNRCPAAVLCLCHQWGRLSKVHHIIHIELQNISHLFTLNVKCTHIVYYILKFLECLQFKIQPF